MGILPANLSLASEGTDEGVKEEHLVMFDGPAEKGLFNAFSVTDSDDAVINNFRATSETGGVIKFEWDTIRSPFTNYKNFRVYINRADAGSSIFGSRVFDGPIIDNSGCASNGYDNYPITQAVDGREVVIGRTYQYFLAVSITNRHGFFCTSSNEYFLTTSPIISVTAS